MDDFNFQSEMKRLKNLKKSLNKQMVETTRKIDDLRAQNKTGKKAATNNAQTQRSSRRTELRANNSKSIKRAASISKKSYQSLTRKS